MDPRVIIADEVVAALRAGRPVVALETAVVTHGMPRTALGRAPLGDDERWATKSPTNLEVARLLMRRVRAGGATPAVMAVIDGVLRIGVDDAMLARLASDERAVKASSRDLAAAMLARSNAGLTVAGTLRACALAATVPSTGGRTIRVFATGGIGGAHRRWNESADISADLQTLARTPVCVVCAGAKSILDLRATFEMLDSLGVPVVGYRTSAIPRFTSRSDAALRVPLRLDTPKDVAELCSLHWNAVGCDSAVLAVQEPPADAALPAELIERATAEAHRRAEALGVGGADMTPHLLAEIAALTEGRSLDTNIALLAANAALAAEVAVCLARRDA